MGVKNAISAAAAIPRMMSLLVVRNGTLVVEEYFRGNHADSLNDLRSVTKSVVSTLTGLSVEAGYLTGLDQTLGELLPDAPYHYPEQRGISVRRPPDPLRLVDSPSHGSVLLLDSHIWCSSGCQLRLPVVD